MMLLADLLGSYVREWGDVLVASPFSDGAGEPMARRTFNRSSRAGIDTVIQDLRYGIRQLVRQPGSSFAAVLTLGLGIGASAAVFSVIDATMLRPLPYPDPEQLVSLNVEVTWPDGGTAQTNPSMADVRLWQESSDVFSAVAGWASSPGRIVQNSEPERIAVSQFSEDYLAIHGVRPLIGRGFTREDTDFGAPAVGLLGYGYWRSRYAAVWASSARRSRSMTAWSRSSGSCLPPSTPTFRLHVHSRFARNSSTSSQNRLSCVGPMRFRRAFTSSMGVGRSWGATPRKPL
jgi:hypothetical protein